MALLAFLVSASVCRVFVWSFIPLIWFVARFMGEEFPHLTVWFIVMKYFLTRLGCKIIWISGIKGSTFAFANERIGRARP